MSLNEAIASAFVRILPDTSKFESELERGVAAPTEALAGRISSSFKKVGAMLAGGFAASQVFSYLKSTIDAASDLNETINKTQVLFGDAAQSIINWASTAAEKFGQSKQQALDAASTFAVFGQSAGLQGQKLADFATSLTGLASDLASFYNTSPEEAIYAIGAALRGETEPIRRFGVLLDDATMRQKAFEMGLTETTKKALHPQTRALVAQALIFEQTKFAQGDFARTSNGVANQQRILAARLTNVKTAIGSALLPGALKLTTVLSGLIPIAQNLGEGFSRILGPAMEMAAQALGNIVNWAREFASKHADQLKGALAGIATLITFKVVPALFAMAAGWAAALAPVVAIVGVIASAGFGLVELYKRSETFREILAPLIELFNRFTGAMKAVYAAFKSGGFGAAWNELVDQMKNLWPVAKQLLSDFARNVADWFVDTFIPAVKRNVPPLVRAMWEWIKDVVPPALQQLWAWLQAIGGWIANTGGPWLWDKTKTLASALWDWIKDAVPAALEQLGVWLGQLGSWIVGTGLPWLGEKAAVLIGALLDWIGRAASEGLPKLGKWMGELAGWVVTKGVPWLVMASRNLMDAILSFIADAAREAPGKLLSFVLTMYNWIKTTGVDLMGKAFGAIAGVIEGVFKAAFNAIASFWNGTVGKIEFKAPDWIPVVGGKGFDVPDIPLLRAKGGSVVPGQDYIVGERGPELFRSSTPGRIIPNHRLGAEMRTAAGNTSFYMTFNEKVDPMQVSAEVAWVLGR